MAKSPIVLPLSTTFLQRFSQHFSTDGGRKPIGRRTRMVAHLGGALVSARLCRLPEQEVHQPSKKCTNRARAAPNEQELHPLRVCQNYNEWRVCGLMSSAGILILWYYTSCFSVWNCFFQHVETFLRGRHIGCCRVSFYYSHNCFGCIHDRRVFLLFRKLGQFNTVIYRIYDLDNSLAIIFQILCCTNRIGTWKRMGCINDNSFGFENPYLNSNRNGLFDE